MDILKATNILSQSSTAENIKYFKDQTKHFNKEPTSNLKDYLDFINSDVSAWLSSLPKTIKGKSTFHKYKAPIYVLLEHKDVMDTFGQVYCANITKNIKLGFKECINKILEERNNNTPADDDNHTEVSIDDDDDTSELDINTLEPVCSNETYKAQFEALKVKYEILEREHIRTKALLECADKGLERVWELVYKLANK